MLGRLFIGGALFAVTAEVAVRVIRPTPRAQVLVEQRDLEIRELNGVVVWSALSDPKVESAACVATPEARRAVFVGSSILRGSGLKGPSVFTEVMRDAALQAGWCLDNLAQPAASSEQKRAIALAALDEARPPDRLYWEVWQNDGGHFVRFGDTAINLGGYDLDATGHPRVLLVPAAIAATLFDGSAAWRFAVLAMFGGPDESGDPIDRWRGILEDDLGPVVARAAALGVEVVLVVCPPLDQPFSASATRPHRGFGAVWTFAGERGLRWIRLAAALEDRDYLELRADPCCHYNAVGHAALAELFLADLARGAASNSAAE